MPPFSTQRSPGFAGVTASPSFGTEEINHCKVFILNANEDERHRRDLKKHLRPADRHGVIRISPSQVVGSVWLDALRAGMRNADVIVILGSVELFACDELNGPILEAFDREATQGGPHVLPVRLRACVWECTPFSGRVSHPRNGSPLVNDENQTVPDNAWADLEREILQVASARHRASIDPVPGVRGVEAQLQRPSGSADPSAPARTTIPPGGRIAAPAPALAAPAAMPPGYPPPISSSMSPPISPHAPLISAPISSPMSPAHALPISSPMSPAMSPAQAWPTSPAHVSSISAPMSPAHVSSISAPMSPAQAPPMTPPMHSPMPSPMPPARFEPLRRPPARGTRGIAPRGGLPPAALIGGAVAVALIAVLSTALFLRSASIAPQEPTRQTLAPPPSSPAPTAAPAPLVALPAMTPRASAALTPNPAQAAFDDTNETAWCKAAGDGLEPWIEASAPSGSEIAEVVVTGGWDFLSPIADKFSGNPDMWAHNNVATRLRLEWEGGSASVSFTRADRGVKRAVTIAPPATRVRIVVEAVNRSTGANTTCLDGLQLRGRRIALR